MIKKGLKEMKGKKIIVFFKYNNIPYNTKKSGKLIDCDDKFFILDEIRDGVSTYSYDFVISVMEDKYGNR